MHKITMYENILEMVEHEVSEIQKSGIKTKEDACTLSYLLSSVDDITNHIDYLKMRKAIEEDAENNEQQSYSETGGNGNSYNSYGYSGRNMRRYSMGGGSYGRPYDMSYDYSNRTRNSLGQYSRDEAKHKMVDKLYTMMAGAANEEDRSVIQDCISRLER